MTAKTIRSCLASLRGLALAAACSALLLSAVSAQEAKAPAVEFPAASPASTVVQRVGLTDITVVYSRPGVKGRVVFGGIVPFGTVWRTGANASTKISFSTPVKLGGMDVPAGHYALYTIPGADEWTIILDKDTSLWGAFNYDAKYDLVRFTVKPEALSEPVETFTMQFDRVRDDSAILDLSWEKTRVPVPIEVNVVGTLGPKIEAAMAAPGKKSANFDYQAATFYFNHGLDAAKALEWVNAMLAEKPRSAYEGLYLKAEILAQEGDKKGAIAAARESLAGATKAEGPQSSLVKMNEDLIASLR